MFFSLLDVKMWMFAHWVEVSEVILLMGKITNVCLNIGRPFVVEFRQPARTLYQPEEFVAVQRVCSKRAYSVLIILHDF